MAVVALRFMEASEDLPAAPRRAREEWQDIVGDVEAVNCESDKVLERLLRPTFSLPCDRLSFFLPSPCPIHSFHLYCHPRLFVCASFPSLCCFCSFLPSFIRSFPLSSSLRFSAMRLSLILFLLVIFLFLLHHYPRPAPFLPRFLPRRPWIVLSRTCLPLSSRSPSSSRSTSSS